MIEPCGDTSSGWEKALRGPAHCPPRNGQMKNMARSYLLWPGWIQTLKIRSSHAKYVNFYRAAPLHPWEWTEKSWCCIHIDHAGPFMGQLFNYFEKKSSYVSGVSVCIFVVLSVAICVTEANNIAGTISWCLRTNEILPSKHDIAALKVKQGHFETAILIPDNFVVFHYNWMCWKASYLNIFIIETSSAVMQLCKGSYFNVAPGSRIYDLVRMIIPAA